MSLHKAIRTGFEPATSGVTSQCSTIELTNQVTYLLVRRAYVYSLRVNDGIRTRKGIAPTGSQPVALPVGLTHSAPGESRTHTPFRAPVSKTGAAAITPLVHVRGSYCQMVNSPPTSNFLLVMLPLSFRKERYSSRTFDSVKISFQRSRRESNPQFNVRSVA